MVILPLMPNRSKLGSALYKFRKAAGILEAPLPAPKQRRLSPQQGQTFANWTHNVHGEVLNATVTDLIKLFPDQKLTASNLSRVRAGKQSQHKGWTLIQAKEPPKNVILLNAAQILAPFEDKDTVSYSVDLLQRGA